jgi:uncharacterized protein YbbC (DUF1343 family)
MGSAVADPPPLPGTKPSALPALHRRRIDAVVKSGIASGDYPGAVVLVQRDGHTVFHRAYGHRSVKPVRAVMSEDTVFDLASLTKPVATATAIMILADRGKLDLADPVSKHLPGCALSSPIASLLTHRSGLAAANHLKDYRGGRAAAVTAICALEPTGVGKERYSDLGYILLGEVVAHVSGKSLSAFCRDAIFSPLKMKDTGFTPPASLRVRAAATEKRDGAFLAGTVHDPRAAALDGVAGHAGLFSTARDLARWADMLLAEGELDGVRVLSASAARAMLEPRPNSRRTLAMVRPVVGGVGHTGFTGTSIWLQPERQTALVILASRLHPDGEGSVSTLRRDVRGAVIAANRKQDVTLGVDALRKTGFARFAGKRVGLITNATGRSRDGTSTAALLQGADDVKLGAIFAPEHGFAAAAEGAVSDGRDDSTGVPIYSLYGKHNRPTAAQLASIDVLVFDIQSIGARFYTYVTTLGYALEAAARYHKPIVVLDRPNPIGGTRVDGPVLEASRTSFVGYHPMPVRHGMTIGELARLFVGERKLGAQLEVVRITGWRRDETFVDTGLPWTDPSPNIRSPEAALLYPGLALVEMTNVSVGRGTDAPFSRVGAPWMKPASVLVDLKAANLDGVDIAVDTFTPRSRKHAGKTCHGLRFTVTDPNALRSVRLGIALALALRKRHPTRWRHRNLVTLMGHAATVDAIVRNKSLDEVTALWQADLSAFTDVRAKYLLYP